MAVEQLEARCVLDAAGLLDAPWRSFDTGYYPGVMGPIALAVGDLDADGYVDAVAGNYHGGTPGLSILQNNRNGTYRAPQELKLPISKSVADVGLADVDRDGDLDVIATVPDVNGLTNEIRFFRNLSGGQRPSRGIRFSGGTIYASGPGPVGLAIGDFTRDGFPDLVTANYGYIAGNNATISLVRHNGQIGPAAGFLAPLSFNVGNHPTRVAAGDVNNDGWLDVVVGRSGWGGSEFGMLTVLVNDQSGGFAAPVHYEALPGAEYFSAAVALSDLDLDGDLDLIGAGGQSAPQTSRISVRRNTGDGSYGLPEVHALEQWSERTQHLAVGDLNGDGFPDIIGSANQTTSSDGWHVLLSDGAGGFQPSVRYEADASTAATVATDADADGDTDVIAVAWSAAVITVHRNPGNGVFPILTRFPAGYSLDGFDTADVDKDGDRDVVTSSNNILASDPDVHVLRNQGDGTFLPKLDIHYSVDPRGVWLRDVNNDGYPDLLTNHTQSGYDFGRALNNGNGTFGPLVATDLPGNCGPGTIDAFDLDNDGDLDGVQTEEASAPHCPQRRIWILENDGSGTFSVAHVVQAALPHGIAGADLNHDGNIDLIAGYPGEISFFPGNGDLTFSARIGSGAYPASFAMADMNNDGELDVAMVMAPLDFFTQHVGVSLGNGDGTFQPAWTILGETSLSYGPGVDIRAADVNLDGNVDVLLTNSGSNDLSLFMGTGNGRLKSQQRYGAGIAPRYSAVADFTGDGRPDGVTSIALPPSGGFKSVVLLRGLSAGQAQRRDVPAAAPASGSRASVTAALRPTVERLAAPSADRVVSLRAEPEPTATALPEPSRAWRVDRSSGERATHSDHVADCGVHTSLVAAHLTQGLHQHTPLRWL
jgi:hypothetical protein